MRGLHAIKIGGSGWEESDSPSTSALFRGHFDSAYITGTFDEFQRKHDGVFGGEGEAGKEGDRERDIESEGKREGGRETEFLIGEGKL